MGHKLDSLKAQRGTRDVTSLAKAANVSDQTIIRAENGDAVDPHVSQRIADALGTNLTTLGKRDL